jgi:hypothetical protein
MQTIRVHTKITVDSIREGDPPVLIYHKIATRLDGKQRLFAQSVKITDRDLFSRLYKEVRAGDQITVCIEQILGGGISNVLVDFATVLDVLPVAL